jgi:site-specific DNA-methyltransferase (adenine-specific)
MNIESTNDNTPTTPAITYSECYAQVFLGDCLELYKNIEPKSIDLILTDLPYGTTACKWDTIIPFDKLWEMVNYLLKPNGAFITTASQPFTSALVMSNPKMFKYEWIWEKNSPTGILTAKSQPMKNHESILVFCNGKTLYNKQPTKSNITDRPLGKSNWKDGIRKTNETTGTIYKLNTGIQILTESVNPRTVLNFNVVPRATGTIHPTQKPVSLMEYLILTYTNELETVLDNCMGSGTTGVACKNLNRNFIGIEKDEAYFKIAEQRINARTLFS